MPGYIGRTPCELKAAMQNRSDSPTDRGLKSSSGQLSRGIQVDLETGAKPEGNPALFYSMATLYRTDRAMTLKLFTDEYLACGINASRFKTVAYLELSGQLVHVDNNANGQVDFGEPVQLNNKDIPNDRAKALVNQAQARFRKAGFPI